MDFIISKKYFLENNLKKDVKDTSLIKNCLKLIINKLKRIVPDRVYITYKFLKKRKKLIQLKKPQTFSEKIQWLKLFNRNPLMTNLSDKYNVRDYIISKGFEYILNDLYYVYNSVDEIDLSKLPDSFVLKATHNSGGNIICKDKSKLNWEKLKKDLSKSLNINYFWHGREWQYKNIKAKIVCEKYLQEDNSELLDYKFWCFNGDPKFLQVDLGRYTNHKRNLYDLDWNLKNFRLAHENADEEVKKPMKLKEMIEIARKLSEGFKFVRVDLFYVNNKIYFGEMTFSPGDGIERFYPDEYDKRVGDMLKL